MKLPLAMINLFAPKLINKEKNINSESYLFSLNRQMKFYLSI